MKIRPMIPTERSVAVDSADKDPRLQEAAKMYEKQFLREMVKAMRATVPESDLVPANAGERVFRQQLDDQYAEKWGDQGGIGLADLIYDNISERYGLGKKPGPVKR